MNIKFHLVLCLGLGLVYTTVTNSMDLEADYRNRAILFEKTEELKKTIEEYKKCIELTNNFSNKKIYLLKIAKIHEKIGNYLQTSSFSTVPGARNKEIYTSYTSFPEVEHQKERFITYTCPDATCTCPDATCICPDDYPDSSQTTLSSSSSSFSSSSASSSLSEISATSSSSSASSFSPSFPQFSNNLQYQWTDNEWQTYVNKNKESQSSSSSSSSLPDPSLKKSLDFDNKDLDTEENHRNKAIIHEKKEEWKQAIEECKKCIALTENHKDKADYYYLIARFSEKLNNYAEIKEAAKKIEFLVNNY